MNGLEVRQLRSALSGANNQISYGKLAFVLISLFLHYLCEREALGNTIRPGVGFAMSCGRPVL